MYCLPANALTALPTLIFPPALPANAALVTDAVSADTGQEPIVIAAVFVKVPLKLRSAASVVRSVQDIAARLVFKPAFIENTMNPNVGIGPDRDRSAIGKCPLN